MTSFNQSADKKQGKLIKSAVGARSIKRWAAAGAALLFLPL